MADQVELVQSSFAKVYAKKAVLSNRIHAEMFDQVPFSREFMQDTAPLQKEGFISVLIRLMQIPQVGSSAQKRMDELRAMHLEMGITPPQIEQTGSIIVRAFREELASELTQEELEAWQQSIGRFSADLSAGL